MIRLHRWLGFGLMVWFLFEALSGGFLAVSDDIDRVIHPDWYTHAASDLGPSAAVKAAQSAVEQGRASLIVFPEAGDGIYQVYVTDESGTDWRIFVDPSTAHVNAINDSDDSFEVLVLRLHADFNASAFFGVSTTAIVGWLGIAWLVTLVLGFVVTRKRRRAVSRRHVFRRGRGRYAFHLDMHNAVGLLLVIPATAAVLTGVVLEFPQQSDALVSALSPGSYDGPGSAVPTSSVNATGTRASLDFVTEGLHSAGFADIDSITIPLGNPAGVFTAYAHGSGFSPSQGLFSGQGASKPVYVDQYSGQVIPVEEEPESVASQILDDWSPSIHFGTILSWFSRLLWVLVGLGTLVLAVTALYMRAGRYPWQNWKRRRARAAALQQAADAESGDSLASSDRSITPSPMKGSS